MLQLLEIVIMTNIMMPGNAAIVFKVIIQVVEFDVLDMSQFYDSWFDYNS